MIEGDVMQTPLPIEWDKLKAFLPIRPKDSHKGDYGHVLVIGGDYGMGGAVRMAAEAALRVGAGLVSVATRPEHLNIVSAVRPEIMCHEVNTAEELQVLLEKATVVLIGPGLGQSEWSLSLFEAILTVDKPMVLDAEALHCLANAPIKKDHWILTPHPGEAARLLKTTCQEIQEARQYFVEALQAQYGGVAILKGMGTLIKAEKESTYICTKGNPGMASGGMGDVLSGVITGLLAQGIPLVIAAKMGVYIHALAADQAALQEGERGLLASDLLPHLRALVNGSHE